MGLRTHQREIKAACEAILAGRSHKNILAHVYPGGGKSLLPQIFAKTLIPHCFDKLCWIVPRDSLRVQGASDFCDSACRRLVGHSLEIRESCNDLDPCRGTAGHITTYQAIATNPEVTISEFKRHRYGLVLDEFHHCAVGETLYPHLQRLIGMSMSVLAMSGDLERHDGKQIVFLEYEPAFRNGKSGCVPILRSTQNVEYVRYTRTHALADMALIPVNFLLSDARVKFMDDDGLTCDLESIANAGDMTRAGLWAAVNSDYAKALLTQAFQHFQQHRDVYNSRAKMLVVCASQRQAKDLMKYLGHPKADIAISDSDDPKGVIRRFKRGDIDVLFTVAMAYEGLNVPSITHIASLTYIRSKPWINQMINRATRYDSEAGPWKNQRAFVFCPDDILMREIKGQIEEDDAPFIRLQEDGERTTLDDENREQDSDAGLLPLASSLTKTRSEDLGGERIDYEETARIREAMERHGFGGGSPIDFKRAIADLGFVAVHDPQQVESETTPIMTPAEREENLRQSINHAIKRRYKGDSERIIEANNRIKIRFGKGRSEMTEQELCQVWEWLQKEGAYV